MKKFAIIMMCFVLCLGLLTACRGNSSDETAPSTDASTQSTAPMTTRPSTAPSTQSTAPSTNGGVIDGNGDAAGAGGKVGRMP